MRARGRRGGDHGPAGGAVRLGEPLAVARRLGEALGRDDQQIGHVVRRFGKGEERAEEMGARALEANAEGRRPALVDALVIGQGKHVDGDGGAGGERGFQRQDGHGRHRWGVPSLRVNSHRPSLRPAARSSSGYSAPSPGCRSPISI
jgi:hypothetical protein